MDIQLLYDCGDISNDFNSTQKNYFKLFKNIFPNKNEFESQIFRLIRQEKYELFEYAGPDFFIDQIKEEKNEGLAIFNSLTLNVLSDWFKILITTIFDVSYDECDEILYDELGLDSFIISFELIEKYYGYNNIIKLIGKLYVKNNVFHLDDLKTILIEFLK